MAKKLSKVRIAFLGCGGMMGAHANRLKNHPDVEICALGDISQSQLDKFVQRHFTQDWTKPVPPLFCSENHDRMYRQTKPDAGTSSEGVWTLLIHVIRAREEQG